MSEPLPTQSSLTRVVRAVHLHPDDWQDAILASQASGATGFSFPPGTVVFLNRCMLRAGEPEADSINMTFRWEWEPVIAKVTP